MSNIHSMRFLTRALLVTSVGLASWSPAYAGSEFKDVHDADPNGSVEILDISGSIELTGWDRPQVEVTGPADMGDRVRIASSGDHTTIHVRPGGSGDGSHLVIHVPAQSMVSASLVSADLKVGGIRGDVNLRTVSGNLIGEVGGNLIANTATGDVKMTAREARMVEVRTISGDVQLSSGASDVEIATVSGDAKIDLGTVSRGRLKSISGNFTIKLGLAPDAQLDGESVSGNLNFDFPSTPQAEFHIDSFSGIIENCFGPKAVEAHYGPGSRLEFKSEGSRGARVRVETKNGNVKLCTAGA